MNILKCLETINQLCCVAQKGDDSGYDICPIQGMYVKLHDKQSGKIHYENIISFLKANNEKHIALYGAGYECGLLINALHLNDMEKCIDYIFDTDVAKAGNSYRGYSIKYPTLKKIEEVDLILIATTEYADEIYNMLRMKNIDMKKVLKITDL